jgi:hypothetical protein
MAEVKISGHIVRIFPSETHGNFEKRRIWVKENEGEYPSQFELEAQQAYCKVLDGFKEGDVVNCSVSVRGRHWVKRDDPSKEGVMNTLKCWKIERAAGSAAALPPAGGHTPETYFDAQPAAGETVDDLPF